MNKVAQRKCRGGNVDRGVSCSSWAVYMLAGEAVLSIRGRGLDNKHDIARSFARCAFACSLIYFYATATAR